MTAPAGGLRRDGIEFRAMRLGPLAIACAWVAALAWANRNVVIDDPWITFRYARNLLDGHGFAFNPGDPLEGYSNFLWVLLSALSLALNVEPLDTARAVSALAAFGLLALLCFVAPGMHPGRDEPRRPHGSLLATLLLGSCYPLAAWVAGGLETVAQAFLAMALAVASAAAVDRGSRLAAACAFAALSALLLLRPEGPMYAAVPVVALGLALFGSAERRAGAKPLAAALLGAAVVLALYTWWRHATFGTIVANTVSAKIGGDPLAAARSGLRYLGGYFLGAPALLLAFAAAGAWRAWRHRSEADPVFALAGALAALQLSFAVAVGGDWMPGYRFLVPALAPLCLLAAFGLGMAPKFAAGVAALFLMLAGVLDAKNDKGVPALAVGLSTARWVADGRPLVQPLVDIGWELRALSQADDTIAMSEAGVVPYYSGLRLIDMLGLVDREIAEGDGGLHAEYDADSVLRRAPRFILLGFTDTPAGPAPTWPPDRQMCEHPRFREEYAELRQWPRWMTDGFGGRLQGRMVLYERGRP
ncbi:MAG: hypothetical protein SF028_13155 [Candidatus Sumerlaeia bacterium]|nr:hypothetical protein [Candidatus Sumerlaeia bacterium]